MTHSKLDEILRDFDEAIEDVHNYDTSQQVLQARQEAHTQAKSDIKLLMLEIITTENIIPIIRRIHSVEEVKANETWIAVGGRQLYVLSIDETLLLQKVDEL